MKGLDYYIAVGYPIGALTVNEHKTYQIENNGKLLGLNQSGYDIWKNCLQGISVSELESLFRAENGPYQFETEVAQMTESGSIVIVDIDDVPSTFTNLKDLKVIRQGLGLGEINDKYYVVIHNQQIELDAIDFMLWTQSNYTKTIEQLTREFIATFNTSEIAGQEILLSAVLKLIQHGLVFLIR